MGKKIFFDDNAQREFDEFTKEVQKEFVSYLDVLKEEGRLAPPEGKKIGKKLFEIRVTKEGTYRGLYAYVWKEFIVLLHFFQKKTQKTPLKNLKRAQKRLRRYE